MRWSEALYVPQTTVAVFSIRGENASVHHIDTLLHFLDMFDTYIQFNQNQSQSKISIYIFKQSI